MDRHVAALLAMTGMSSFVFIIQRLGVGPSSRHDKRGEFGSSREEEGIAFSWWADFDRSLSAMARKENMSVEQKAFARTYIDPHQLTIRPSRR